MEAALGKVFHLFEEVALVTNLLVPAMVGSKNWKCQKQSFI